MKRIFKTLLVIVIIAVVLAGGLIAYIYFGKTGDRNNFSVVPSDAVFALETSNLTEGWKTLSDSKMWQHLKQNAYFKDLNKDIDYVDGLLKGNKAMDMLLSGRELLMSAHMVDDSNYDFLFVVNLGQSAKMSFLTDAIEYVVDDYNVSKRTFAGVEVQTLTDKKHPKDKISLAIIENLLVCSYSQPILESAIEQRDLKTWEKNKDFQSVAEGVQENSLFRFYFNYGQLGNFMKGMMQGEDESVKSLASALNYSAFKLNLGNKDLTLNGYTGLNAASSSYIKALSQVSPARKQVYDAVPDQAALYLSMTFNDYEEFYKRLEMEFSMESSNDHESYEKSKKKLEKLLSINLKEQFFNWIGNEIAFVKLRPSQTARMEDVVVFIHSNDIKEAQVGLGQIVKQVSKRTPGKFKEVTYRNYPIHFLDINGFFKMFFGKMFGKLEKPYFTYLGDHVVFSNSQAALEDVISSYINGRTLSNSEKFMDFMERFDQKSNASVFVQTPKMYQNMYHFANKETREQVKDNKEFILSFATLGLQFSSEKGLLRATLIAEHDSAAMVHDAIELLETEAAEELFSDEVENLAFKLSLRDSVMPVPGKHESDYPDSVLKKGGKLDLKNLQGIWRSYYKSGNLKNAVNYKDGKVAGTVLFYYDEKTPVIKAEAMFNDDKLVGEYKEFYPNRVRKALITFEDGKKDGVARYFYNTGVLKIEGEYKRGKKNGKWSFFDENGKMISKEKWRNGSQR